MLYLQYVNVYNPNYGKQSRQSKLLYGEKMSLTTSLLQWYTQHHRHMPWRHTPAQYAAQDFPQPYHVWISETMLQQTTVATVTARFTPFVQQFATVQALASATQSDVCAAWAGLGYYARARNLHTAAQQLVAHHGGNIPTQTADLLALKGVGHYTAAAVRAIAFGIADVPIDGNLLRIGARLMACDTPLPHAAPTIGRFMHATFLHYQQPYNVVQALMDIGATVCMPKKALCTQCPLQAGCAAAKTAHPTQWPYKQVKAVRVEHHWHVWVIKTPNGDLYAPLRPSTGLWGGMRGFIMTQDQTPPVPCIDVVPCTPFKHLLTHQALHITPMQAYSATPLPCDDVIAPSQIATLPTVMQKAFAMPIKPQANDAAAAHTPDRG